jgi:MFS transporter, YNFM family, putative membrane transport protein
VKNEAALENLGGTAEDGLTRRLVLTLYVCCFGSLASMRVCDAMLPVLAGTFSVTMEKASQSISVFAMAYGVVQLFFGPAGDRFGKIRVIALAAVLCTLGNTAALFAQSFDQLIAARLFSGAAAAGIVPLTMAWIGDNVAYERRQAVLAKLLGATIFGMVTGQWAGGAVSAHFGWRGAFLLMAVVFCVGAMLAVVEARNSKDSSALKSGNFSQRVKLVLVEPWARVVLIVTFLEGALAYSVLAFLPTHLHAVVGLSMSGAALTVALYGIGGLTYSRCAGPFLARLGERGFVLTGGVLLFGSLVGLGATSSVYLALPACFITGFGFYALHNALQLNATQMAPHARGTAVSLFSCVLFLGQSCGILIAAMVVEEWSTRGWFAFSGVGLLALALTFSALIKRRRERATVCGSPAS